MCPSCSAEALRGHINVPIAYKELIHSLPRSLIPHPFFLLLTLLYRTPPPLPHSPIPHSSPSSSLLYTALLPSSSLPYTAFLPPLLRSPILHSSPLFLAPLYRTPPPLPLSPILYSPLSHIVTFPRLNPQTTLQTDEVKNVP